MKRALCPQCVFRGHVKDEEGEETYWCSGGVEEKLHPLHGKIIECSKFFRNFIEGQEQK